MKTLLKEILDLTEAGYHIHITEGFPYYYSSHTSIAICLEREGYRAKQLLAVGDLDKAMDGEGSVVEVMELLRKDIVKERNNEQK